MARVNGLSWRLNERISHISGLGLYAGPAIEAFQFNLVQHRWTGQHVSDAHGLVLAYISRDLLPAIFAGGQLGRDRTGVWVTPQALGSELAPYEFGLPSPRDCALIIDPAATDSYWWGPGVAPPVAYPLIWQGGGLEFYVEHPIPQAAFVDVLLLEPGADV